jgi:hypothetical protein
MTNDVLRMTQFHYSFAYIGTRYGFQMPEEVREEREWKKGEERFVLTVLMRVYMISYYSFLQFIGYTKRSSWRYKGTLAFVSTLLTVKPSYVNT